MWAGLNEGRQASYEELERGNASELGMAGPIRETTALVLDGFTGRDARDLGEHMGDQLALRPRDRSAVSRVHVAAGAALAVLALVAVACSVPQLRSPLLRHSGRGGSLEGKYSQEGGYYEGHGCLDAAALNDFSSKDRMEQAGWMFNWTDDYTFKPRMYEAYVPGGSYWGFSMAGVGRLSLHLTGQGVVKVNFGNLLGSPGSRVQALLGDRLIGRAGPTVTSMVAAYPFHDGDMLHIMEAPLGIVVVSSITIDCGEHAISEFHFAQAALGNQQPQKAQQAVVEVAERAIVADYTTTSTSSVTTSMTTTYTTTSTTRKDQKALSMYCFALCLPFGYEPGLLRAQQKRSLGIYACDQSEVFSNSTTLLDRHGERLPIDVSLIDMSLAVPYGGRWHTALNTPIFIELWHAVVKQGNYRRHRWVVKADPDSVFFPQRLRDQLRDHGLQRLKPLKKEPQRRLFELGEARRSCTTCGLASIPNDSCETHVQWIQSQGYSCEEALMRAARPPPLDCGCSCSMLEACNLTTWRTWSQDDTVMKGAFELDVDMDNLGDLEPAVYFNNCKFGLHGPLEVFSRGAVEAIESGLPRCANLEEQAWGEDKFLDRCMMQLGVTRVNDFALLSEAACGEEPSPCKGGDVAFHPFKDVEDYLRCWSSASGHEIEASADDLLFK